MFLSLTVSIAFTIVFAVTGVYALYRLASSASGSTPDVDRVAELAHLLMSVAMIAMTWGCTGGPETASGVVQLVVFGLFTLWFLVGAVAGGLAAALHLITTAAMVWMVAAMPLLMGTTASAESAMPGMPGMTQTGPGSMTEPMAAPPAWAVAVTVAFAVLLAGTAVLWVRRGVTGPAAAGSHTVGAVVVLARPTALRLDACCHALMSLGMGAALLAML